MGELSLWVFCLNWDLWNELEISRGKLAPGEERVPWRAPVTKKRCLVTQRTEFWTGVAIRPELERSVWTISWGQWGATEGFIGTVIRCALQNVHAGCTVGWRDRKQDHQMQKFMMMVAWISVITVGTGDKNHNDKYLISSYYSSDPIVSALHVYLI